jgi:hypothetical protein
MIMSQSNAQIMGEVPNVDLNLDISVLAETLFLLFVISCPRSKNVSAVTLIVGTNGSKACSKTSNGFCRQQVGHLGLNGLLCKQRKRAL